MQVGDKVRLKECLERGIIPSLSSYSAEMYFEGYREIISVDYSGNNFKLKGMGAHIYSMDLLVKKEEHSGSKYMKEPVTYENGLSDIYCDLIKYEITNPAIQHAFKKVAMSGLRGKASKVQDLEEAIDALTQAILLERL